MKSQWGSRLAVLAILGLMAWPVAAQEVQHTQKERMANCNQLAGDKKGDERKAFMKQCLSTKKAVTQESTTPKENAPAAAAAPAAVAPQPAAPQAAVPPKMSPQERMKYCNVQAAGKKGDERKAFMKQCLSTKKAAAAQEQLNANQTLAAEKAAPQKPMTQKEKMKYCNKQAVGKKGDDRKAFMKECLSAAS